MRENISQLENSKLSWYYMSINKEITLLKKEIAEKIYDIFNIHLDDKEKINQIMQNIEKYISPEQREKFEELVVTKKALNKEIGKRQLQLLKEVGFTIPNQLQCLFLKEFS